MQQDFERYAGEVQEGLTPWQEPVPFESTQALPDFPVHLLPKPLDAYVDYLSESTQTPPTMGGLLSLGVLSTAFQRRLDVQVNPDWREPLCLYLAACALPGERKSAVISALAGPLYRYEREQRELEAPEIAQNQAERAMLEKRLEAAKSAAAKGKGDAAAKRAEALDLAAQLAEFKDLHPFRLLSDDATPEKLADLMDSQDGCMTVASAEGGIFDTLQGRYDNKGGLDIFLKGHAGDPVMVDRISRGGNFIEKPRLTLMLCVQPQVLQGLMENGTFKGRGLCGRFLYAVCRSKLGSRVVSPPAIPGQLKAEYWDFVRRILSEEYKGTIRLDPDANRIREQFQAYIEAKLGPGGDLEDLADWGGKIVGQTVRIAALLHAAAATGDPTQAPINPAVMAAAVAIGDVLLCHARAAYGLMGGDSAQADARYLWRRIVKSGRDELSKRDAFRLCQGKFRKLEAMEPTLQTLAEMGYVRELEVSTGGRPTTKIMVNPLGQK